MRILPMASGLLFVLPTGLAATIEGAVQSEYTAAEEIVGRS